MTLVFVYGTLKSGRSNHRVMEAAGGQLIGVATRNCAQLYRVASFPGLIETNNPDDVVIGEVFDVQHMGPLDGLEGYTAHTDSGMYLRRDRSVVLHDGTPVMAGLYVWNSVVDPVRQPLIEGGFF